jgi:N-methylhydantoinase A
MNTAIWTRPTDTRQFRFAVDIGGTFTDLVLINYSGGELFVGKVLTTPADPARGVLAGLQAMLSQHDIAPHEVVSCVHATTLVANALIERKGAKTGLLATAGFGDVLELGRELRYDLYDLFIKLPPPLVARELVSEINERVLVDGSIAVPLLEEDVRSAVQRLVSQGVKAIAVSFLHAYANSTHEEQAERIIRDEWPEILVTSSHRVARELREFERTSTTVANAYVQPLVSGYLERLGSGLHHQGVDAPLALMVSAGGLVAAETARALPINLLESGAAAGALVGGYYGALSDHKNVLAFDMGGTTAKACLIDDGVPIVTYHFEAGRVHRFKKGSGLPLKVTSIDMIEIGAGGGSIACLDRLGTLQVGPQSAGPNPGPACYGLGGTQPTVTDADLLLGYLRPDYFLGGTIHLDVDAARTAISQEISERITKEPLDVAWGVYDIVTENMAAAARVHIAERGRDPRNYVLVATGGAGPVHAYWLARKLRLTRVLCPLASGVASAIGLLVAPPRVDLLQTRISPLEQVDWQAVNEMYEQMTREASGLLSRLGVPPESVKLHAAGDLRYVGQGFEVLTELPLGPYGHEAVESIRAAFEAAYQHLYGRTVEGLRIECVNWRLRASGPATGVSRVREALRHRPGANAAEKQVGTRRAYSPDVGGFVATPVYDRYALVPGDAFQGPAIVEERESTVVVGARARFHVDENQTLVMDLDE